MVKRISWQRDEVQIIQHIKSKFDVLSLSSLSKKFERLPSIIKWAIAVIVGGFLYKISEIMISSHVSNFNTIEQINQVIQIQFAFDVVLIAIIVILVATLLRYGELE